MRKRSRTGKPAGTLRPLAVPKTDPNVAAFNLLEQLIASGEAEGKDPIAVAMGRRGGLKGGKARAEKMSQDQRRESAANAARVRWASRKKA
jgi:hypothetical protein